MRSSDHYVLITGGAKGIGLALAKQFHQAGNRVVLVGRDRLALDAAAKALPRVKTCVADIALAADRARLIEEFSAVSVLVNNAGIQCNGDFAQMAAADVQREIDTNLVAPLLLTHGFLPHLQRHPESAIVNVSSALALSPKQSASVYCATKAAVHSFSRSLRWQLADTPVRVFDLMPPLVSTAMTAGRGKDKITPEALAEEFWRGFLADRFDLPIGKAKAAKLLVRWAPGVAERVLRKG